VRGRLLLVILAIGLLCAYAHASAPDSTGLPPSRSRLIPALQSAVLPGWGQLSRREWLRGGFFLLGEAFLAGDALYYWESQYDKPGWDKPGRTFDHDIALGLATWYGLGAVFCALDAYYINEPSSEGNPTLAALQSVIFPGWGQLANGQHWKAPSDLVVGGRRYIQRAGCLCGLSPARLERFRGSGRCTGVLPRATHSGNRLAIAYFITLI